jgi:hypothetical protein
VIEALGGQGHSAKACCRMLDVVPSGYFYWRMRPTSIRQLRQGQLGDLVLDIRRASNGTLREAQDHRGASARVRRDGQPEGRESGHAPARHPGVGHPSVSDEGRRATGRPPARLGRPAVRQGRA